MLNNHKLYPVQQWNQFAAKPTETNHGHTCMISLEWPGDLNIKVKGTEVEPWTCEAVALLTACLTSDLNKTLYQPHIFPWIINGWKKMAMSLISMKREYNIERNQLMCIK